MMLAVSGSLSHENGTRVVNSSSPKLRKQDIFGDLISEHLTPGRGDAVPTLVWLSLGSRDVYFDSATAQKVGEVLVELSKRLKASAVVSTITTSDGRTFSYPGVVTVVETGRNV